jgi:hypothetical protein
MCIVGKYNISVFTTNFDRGDFRIIDGVTSFSEITMEND